VTERAAINQICQIGVETTSGTAVAATKKLQNMNVVFTPKPDVATYRATGHRFITVAEMNREWTELKADGWLDYNDSVYLASGPFGAATITTPGGGTNSRQWVWTPKITGAITPKTYTIEQGDAVRAHKAAFCLFTGFSYKGDREKGFTVSAPLVAQAFTDGITMTASPTAVALAPVPGSHVSLYIDTSSGSIGGTQFTRIFSYEYNYDAGFAPFWALNRTNTSFPGVVDIAPKNTVKLTLEADSTGMGLYPHLQAGDYMYLRFEAIGAIIETTIHYSFVHDVAIKLTSVSDIKDAAGGVFCTDYTGEVAEDSAWNSGQSQVLTIVNSLTAL
jgi:hypothetical protein